MKNLHDLFEETLRDIYYAEKAITKALPKMAKKASSQELSSAFEEHLQQTEGQIERLEQVFKILDKSPRGKKCAAIEGMIEEAEEVIKESESDTVRDAGMLAAAQAVEHYEISRYGTLVAWAQKLGLAEAAELLEQTLDEEKETDAKLSELAESEINAEADAEDDRDTPARKPAKAGARR